MDVEFQSPVPNVAMEVDVSAAEPEKTATSDPKETDESVDQDQNNIQDQAEGPPSDAVEEMPQITYTFMDGGSKQGRMKLFDSLGFSYIFKTSYASGAVVWRCPVRNKDIRYCPATVKQIGNTFERSPKDHVHRTPSDTEAVEGIFRAMQYSIKHKSRKGRRNARAPLQESSTETEVQDAVREVISTMDDNVNEGAQGTVPHTAMEVDAATIGPPARRTRKRGQGKNELLNQEYVEDHPEAKLSSSSVEYDVSLISYSFMDEDSERGKRKLIDSLGFTYNFKKRYAGGAMLWRCSSLTKNGLYCPVTVKKCGTVFERCLKKHVHEAPYGPEAVARIFREWQDRTGDEMSSNEYELPVTYSFVERGTKSGKTKLFDSLGFSYVFKAKYANSSVVWRCPVRNKTVRYCPATVKQSGTVFKRGPKKHVHKAIRGAETVARIIREVKAAAVQQPKEKTGSIVRRVLKENLPDDGQRNAPNIPNVERLCHITRKCRRKLLSREPKDVNFQLEMDVVPSGFLVEDLRVDTDGRHLIFATTDQLALLAAAKCWYVGTTSSVVKEPFTNLFSVHCFVQSGELVGPVPILFVLMTRCRRRDYKAVLRALVRSLPTEAMVSRVVLPFEAEVWLAFRSCLSEVTLSGCIFHWRQELWRKVQELGLETDYTSDASIKDFVRKLMALPLVPADMIQPLFDVLRSKADTEALHELCEYMEETWLGEGLLWATESWCMHLRSIRINDDVEEWHLSLEERVGDTTPFHDLLVSLHDDATLVTTEVSLVSEGKLRRVQRRSPNSLQAVLSRYWEEYGQGTRSAKSLLKAVSKLFGPPT